MLRDLLSHDGVEERCELRGPIGIMALHGGNLERVTDVIATEVADRTGSSLYALVQHAPLRRHVPSTDFAPTHSPKLDGFCDHVDSVISIHGYGREDWFWHLLVGGSHRALAEHVAGHLRSGLPDGYHVVDDLHLVPEGLRGLHPDNPVNRPSNGGAQIELPPTIRWNREAHEWSDHRGTPRTAHVQSLIDALCNAVDTWPAALVGGTGP